MSFLFLATEDVLTEAVGMKLIREEFGDEIYIKPLMVKGFGNLKKRMPNFVQMARHNPVVMFTDLDSGICAPALRDAWFGQLSRPAMFVFRVVVREVESWLMADRANFAHFLGVSEARIPSAVENIADPKSTLVRLAQAGRRTISDEIAPARGSSSPQGFGYNPTLCRFVNDYWECASAEENSDSLRRTRVRLHELRREINGE